MKSKIIQITSDAVNLYALCEDGSIWRYNAIAGWECVLEEKKTNNRPKPNLEDIGGIQSKSIKP